MQTSQYGFLDNKNLIGLWDTYFEPALNGLWSTQIGTMINSDRETESYGWLGAAPSLQPMTADNPTEEQFKPYNYFLRNQEYAVALKIAEKDMRRDKLGMIERRMADTSSKAAEHWNTLSAQTLIANPNGYDGVPLFSNAHNEAFDATGVNQINDVTATQIPSLNVIDAGNVPTAVEAATALTNVIGWFYTLTDDKGDQINGQAQSYTVLTGSVALQAALSYAASATAFAGGQSNQLLGLTTNGLKIDVRFIPRLSPAANQFYVFRNDAPIKALLLQSEVDVSPAVSDKSNDEYIKFRRFLFSIYTSRAVGVGRWQSAIRATFS